MPSSKLNLALSALAALSFGARSRIGARMSRAVVGAVTGAVIAAPWTP